MVTWAHDQLAADLHAHLSGNTQERMCWLDMQLGPSGSPRPDVYAINKSYSRFVATAYECKVSRSDFLADVTAGKWQSYYAFAGAVVFAVPDGLVKVTEIPDAAGLIVRKDAVWRYAKKPRVQALDNLPRSAWMKLLMDGVHRVAGVRRHEATAHVLRERALRKALGEEIARLVQRGDGLRYDIEAEAKNHARSMERIREDNVRKQSEARERDAGAGRLWSQLCELLGLPANSNEWVVQRRIRDAVDQLDADQRVSQLSGVIDASIAALTRAKLHLDAATHERSPDPVEVPLC